MPRFLAILAALLLLLSPAAGQNAKTPPALDLSLMTFNIRYDNPADGPDAWPARRSQVYSLIKDHDPDVIGFQEVLKNQLDDLQGALPRYSAVGVGRDDGKTAGEYSCIFYRKDRFDAPESGTFWLSETPEVAGSKHWGNNCVRICTWVRLTDKAASRSFYAFNTHMDHESQKARDKGAELIARRITGRVHKDEPAILTGDFNAGEENSAVMFLTGRAPRAHLEISPAPPRTDLVDSFRLKHPDESEVGTFHAFKGAKGDTHQKIDYILVPKEAEVLDASIDRRNEGGRYPSDHYIVTAKVRLK